MNSEFEPVFIRLRQILQKHAASLTVEKDSTSAYCLAAKAGPAAVQAWGGKLKQASIPVAWVEIKKAYVSFHLMGIYGNPKLCEGLSEELKARLHGKSCFNFKRAEEPVFKELEQLTARSIAGFKNAGYVTA